MSKRRATGGGIKAAFARQADRATAPAWHSLEVPMTGIAAVPDEYLQELTAKMEGYVGKKEAIAKLLAKSRAAAADSSSTADQSSEVAKWQGAAAICLQQLAVWPGSGIALQLQQQEALLHIMANGDLHTDPMLASKAYTLLLQNLAQHPPARLSGSDSSQPPVLQNAVDRDSGLCWGMFNHQSKPLLQDAPTPFPLLQQLVQNAVRLVANPQARTSSSGGGASSSSSRKGGSQGQALLLLHVVQLLQADLLVRQVAFERYMELAQTLETDAQKDQARSRAATVLQHSLLHRVMQDDSVGGGSWQYTPDSGKGKHQLVRDLLLLVASSGDSVDVRAAPRASRTPSTTAAAATAAVAAATDGDGDAVMQDAEAPAAAAAAAEPAPTTPAAAVVAVQAGIVPEKVPLVSVQELIHSARVLLLLLLQLYSSCEEAGVYGRGGEGRHHMQRLQGGGGQPNDRFGLDSVLLTAIGHCGHASTQYILPQLQPAGAGVRNLQRLLQALPPVHRARLLSLMVVSVIHNRVLDPESEGKLKESGHNLVLEEYKVYLRDCGQNNAGFMQFSPLHIIEAVGARLEWAEKEMFGGKLLFALFISTLISAAAVTLQQETASEQQTFRAAATCIIDYVLSKNRHGLQAAAMDGYRETLSALIAAKQQLSV